MTPEQAVLYSVLICVAGAVLTLLVSKSKSLAGWLAFLTTVATAALIVPAVIRVLTSGPADPHHPQILWVAGGYAMRFYVDGLSAIFLILAVVIAVLAALYSIEHLKKYQNKSAAQLLPVLPAVCGRHVRCAFDHRHDVVLLRLLAVDDHPQLPARALRE